jgi:uncharacterized protein (TIGR02996 family)
MNHEDAFLQSILDDPDDDAPRLVFADWLEENADPQRAQFIRAQCRLAKLGEDDPERYRLQLDEVTLLPEMTQRLLDRKHPRWSGKLGAWVKEQKPAFERGFVARLGTTPTKFLARADEVMKAAPIQHLTLSNAGYKLDELLASPHLARLRSLAMPHNRLRDEAIAGAAALPSLSGLTSLDLTRNRFRIEGATAIAQSPHLGKLERLVLSGNRIHDRGPEALAGSPHLANLKRLELVDCQIGPRGATALANSAHLGRLEWLDLSANRLTDAGARALADATGLPNLTTLIVARNQFSAEGLRALLQNVGLKRLRSLSLNVQGNGAGFWAIRPAEHLRGRLELRADSWDDVRPAELTDSPLLAACVRLTLAGGQAGDQTAAALAAAPSAVGLRALELLNCGLKDVGVRALANSTRLTNLRRLSLAEHRVTKAGVKDLLASPLGRQLTHLDLRTWGLGEDVMKTLAEAEGLDQLVRLRLGGAPPGRWRGALRERFGWRVAFE